MMLIAQLPRTVAMDMYDYPCLSTDVAMPKAFVITGGNLFHFF
jgi:hypothetical protein